MGSGDLLWAFVEPQGKTPKISTTTPVRSKNSQWRWHERTSKKWRSWVMLRLYEVIVFDPKQVTNKDNRSNPKPGDPCHCLHKDGTATLISYAPLAHPARIYQSQVNNKDSMENGVDSSMKQLELFESSDPGQSTLSGKTWQGLSHQITGKILHQLSKPLPTSATIRVTRSSTPNGSECPSVDAEFFSSGSVMESPPEPIFSRLADVLLQHVESKFRLSPKAAAGILRRAEKRGKKLPTILKKALEDVASLSTEQPSTKEKTPSTSHASKKEM